MTCAHYPRGGNVFCRECDLDVIAKYERKGDWIQTFTGRKYWPADPRAGDVNLLDIAHALSMLCRYTGHTRDFYSVAEHSWHVSHLVSPQNALIGLMHDATEAYTNDINRPLKQSLPDYQRVEHLNWLAIARAFNLPEVLPAEVHTADRNMLTVEKAALMHPLPEWETDFGMPAQLVHIRAWEPKVAERRFLRRFYELDMYR